MPYALLAKLSQNLEETMDIRDLDIRDFLPILDQLEMARRMTPEDCSKGLAMIAQSLEKTLGLTSVFPLFEPFDPRTMEAIGRQQCEDLPANFVLLVSQTGYQKNGQIIRYPKVLVSC